MDDQLAGPTKTSFTEFDGTNDKAIILVIAALGIRLEYHLPDTENTWRQSRLTEREKYTKVCVCPTAKYRVAPV